MRNMINTKNMQLGCDCEAIHQDVIDRVRADMPEGDNFYALSNLYKMFADNTRLKILWALTREEMCVCDLAVLLNMTKSAISHQLKSLRLADLVRYNKRGKCVYYSIADIHVQNIFEQGFAQVSK